MTMASSDLLESARSLPALFNVVADAKPDAVAQWRRVDSAYTPISYAQMQARVRSLACGLMRAGIKPGDRIALLMENCPEWAVVDYAVLTIGAVTVPMYCTYRAQDIAYVLNDSGAHMAITSGGVFLTHLISAAGQARHLKRIYCLDAGKETDSRIHPFSDLETSAQTGEDLTAMKKMLQNRLASVNNDTLATLTYTSGTTGNPKGVMLTHGNILANLVVVPDVIRLREGDMMLSFLPLAHALERTGGHFLPYSFGLSVAFAERADTVAKNIAEAHPTLIVTVPRLLEVMRNRILGQVAKQSLLKRAMFNHFLHLGIRAGKQSLPWFSKGILRLLDWQVGRVIRSRFGGRLGMMICGGAPLSVEVETFFEAIGLPVIEGYGMTESAPLISVNPFDDRRLGSVGRPAFNVEVKIADDGEILVRGSSVMAGYWKLRKETKATIIGGWLHTGDIGRLDDGYLYITDRKKDLLVNSGGENIAPQPIERLLLGDELIDQGVIFGDKKPYLVALIAPNKDACTAWAETAGLPHSDWADLCASKVLQRMLQTRISALLKARAPFEQVRRIHVISEPLSMTEGMLTPTLKVKRNMVFERYGKELETLYT